MYDKPGNIENQINKYLVALRGVAKKVEDESCLTNAISWYSPNAKVKKLDLKINGEQIPYTKEFKFLGVTFGHKLNFHSHVNEIRKNVKKD